MKKTVLFLMIVAALTSLGVSAQTPNPSEEGAFIYTTKDFSASNKDVPILQDMASQNIDLNGLIDLSSTPNVKMDVSFFNIILAIKKDYSAANLTILMDFPNEKKMYSLPYFAEGAISYNKTTKKISFLAVGERKVKNSSTYSKFNVEGIVGNDKTATFTIKNAAPGYTGKAFTDKTVFSIN